MKKNLEVKDIKASGAVRVGVFKGVNLTVDKNKSIREAGFYFIGTNNGSVVYATHAGNQYRQRGFEETLIRIRSPRTNQVREVVDYLNSGLVVNLYYMKYNQVRNLMGIEEYRAQNNGHELIGKIRSKYTIHGRLCS